ncbi:ketopantoate reductase family protein [Salicibibacter kimchii]|uniref:2-dehydropantoate 2-reductase n=1 Tax=Salicibibacter kimchii TaxID=2099786 RepID=A0A345C0L1_9BACI|nr:2-dehydropantoate 2-reductase [Salicibibacter kimchii]AXF56742.1 2-dehydropantoate 2-reductase [Salicibibacter kimchii]
MKTLILGAGAMGSLFSGRLKQIGVDVTLYNRENEHVKKINQDGLRILDNDGNITMAKIPVVSNPNKLSDRYDLIIVLVKAYATDKVLNQVLHTIDEDTVVLSLQNGIGNLESLRHTVPYNNVGVGGAGCGGGIIENGTIGHRANGRTYIGFSKGINSRVSESIAHMFTRSGLPATVTTDVESIIWSKLIINIAFNGLTAITRLSNGNAIAPPEGREIIKELVNEAVRVAHAEGIELIYKDPVSECLRLGMEDIGENISSMLSDIINEKRTEIDYINGAIVDYGIRNAIPTPYNNLITNLVKVTEQSYGKIVTDV